MNKALGHVKFKGVVLCVWPHYTSQCLFNSVSRSTNNVMSSCWDSSKQCKSTNQAKSVDVRIWHCQILIQGISSWPPNAKHIYPAALIQMKWQGWVLHSYQHCCTGSCIGVISVGTESYWRRFHPGDDNQILRFELNSIPKWMGEASCAKKCRLGA